MRKAKLGKKRGPHSEETCKKTSKALIGKKHNMTEDGHKRLSDAHKGKPSWNKGKKLNRETGKYE